MSKNSRNQQKDELKIIKEFLHTIGIETQPNGIQCLAPPYPDILCTLTDGNQIAFELVEAGQESTRKHLASPCATEPRSEMVGNEVANSIRSKFEKNRKMSYKCDYPVELVVHNGIVPIPLHPIFAVLLRDIRDLVECGLFKTQFRKVWVFDYMAKPPVIRYEYPERKRPTQS